MRHIVRVPGAVLVAAVLSACGSDSPSGPTPVAVVRVTSPNDVIRVGDTEQYTATTYDASNGVLTGRAISWVSRDPTVATVTQAGVATAVAAGVTTIEATSEGRRGERQLIVVTPPPPAPPVSTAGQLFTVEGLAPGPLTAAFRIGTSPPTVVAVEADGRFGLTSAAQGDPVDLVIDGPGGAYLPALLRFPRVAVPTAGLRVLLTPRRWSIATGTYTSRSIDVSANLAFTPPCTTAGDINCDGYYSKAWTTGIKIWDDATMPVPLAFYQSQSSVAISESDSVAFWAIVRRMEADFGRPLFRPATASELTIDPDGWSIGAVTVRVDASLPAGRGFTNWRWDARGVVFAAVMRVGSTAALASSSLVTHELLHAIGLKHSCAWPTVMGGYGCSSASGLTLQDVGYAHLAMHLARIQRATNAYRNVYEAMQGERVVLLGLGPVSLTLAEALRLAPAVGGQDSAH